MDWKSLEKRYIGDFQKTNTSLRDWCHANNLKYNTARRHIKIQTIKQFHSRSSNSTKCASDTFSAVRTKHNGYSKYIAPQYADAANQVSSLEDELAYTRALLAHQADRLKWFNEQESSLEGFDGKLQLVKSMLPLYELIDRTTARIASLEMSIAKLQQIKQSIEKDEIQKELVLATLEQRKQHQQASQVTYHIDW